MSQDTKSRSMELRVEKTRPHPVSINGHLKELPMIRSLAVRTNVTLNLEKKSNVTAALGQTRGQVAVRPCVNCAKGRGLFTQCVTVSRSLSGACCSCFCNDRSARCSFRKAEVASTIPTGPLRATAITGPASNIHKISGYGEAPGPSTATLDAPAEEVQPHVETLSHSDIVLREENEHLLRRISQKNDIIRALVASAGRIETALHTRGAELHRGFGGLIGSLPQIQSRIEELENYAGATNLLIGAIVEEGRQSSLISIDDRQKDEFVRLYEDAKAGGRIEEECTEKLSFTERDEEDS